MKYFAGIAILLVSLVLSGCSLFLPADVTGTWQGETTEEWPAGTIVESVTLFLLQSGKAISGVIVQVRQPPDYPKEDRFEIRTGFLDGSRLYIYAVCDDTSEWDQDRMLTLTGNLSNGRMSGSVEEYLDSALIGGVRNGTGTTGAGTWYARKVR